MKKTEQIRNLKKLLGSKAELIDLDARVDGRLSYKENKRIILSKAKRRGITRKSVLKFKGSPVFWVDKAEIVNSKRKLKARAKDGSTRARNTFRANLLTAEQFYKWKRNPRRYDILGVDSRGEYISSRRRRERKLTLRDIDKLDIL
jgi:hypothetical protein